MSHILLAAENLRFAYDREPVLHVLSAPVSPRSVRGHPEDAGKEAPCTKEQRQRDQGAVVIEDPKRLLVDPRDEHAQGCDDEDDAG